MGRKGGESRVVEFDVKTKITIIHTILKKAWAKQARY
jgi:hypothetical protein